MPIAPRVNSGVTPSVRRPRLTIAEGSAVSGPFLLELFSTSGTATGPNVLPVTSARVAVTATTTPPTDEWGADYTFADDVPPEGVSAGYVWVKSIDANSDGLDDLESDGSVTLVDCFYREPPTIVVTGELALSGAAALGATNPLAAVGALALSGSAVLSVVGGVYATGSLALAGSAALTSVNPLAVLGALGLAGSAALGVEPTLTSLGKWVDTDFVSGAETADLTFTKHASTSRTDNASSLKAAISTNTVAQYAALQTAAGLSAYGAGAPRFIACVDMLPAVGTFISGVGAGFVRLENAASADAIGQTIGNYATNTRFTIECGINSGKTETTAIVAGHIKDGSNAYVYSVINKQDSFDLTTRFRVWLWSDATNFYAAIEQGGVLVNLGTPNATVYSRTWATINHANNPFWLISGDPATDWGNASPEWFSFFATKDNRLKVTGLNSGEIVKLYDSTDTTLIGKTNGTADGSGVAYIDCTDSTTKPLDFLGGLSVVVRRYQSNGTTLISTAPAVTVYAGDSVAL